MSHPHRLLGLVTAAFLLGCGLGSEEMPGPVPGEEPVSNKTDEPGETTTPGKLEKPVLDLSSIPAETCAKEVGIRGTAAGGASVFAFGGASSSGVSTDANPTNGSFCLPVPLLAGKTNTIEVRAQDPNLGVSEPAIITVVQKACTSTDDASGGTATTTQPVSKNVAYGAPAKSKDAPKQGNTGFITDEKTTTTALFQQGFSWTGLKWDDYNGWVSIRLDKLYELQKIVVRWRDRDGSGSAYGKKYKVLVSPMTDPGDPNLTNGYWQEVANVEEGDGGLDTFDLTSKKPVAQHVALWLLQDGMDYWSEVGAIFDGEAAYEKFALSDVEAWDAPKKVGPPPPPPGVCQ